MLKKAAVLVRFDAQARQWETRSACFCTVAALMKLHLYRCITESPVTSLVKGTHIPNIDPAVAVVVAQCLSAVRGNIKHFSSQKHGKYQCCMISCVPDLYFGKYLPSTQ